MTRQQSKDNAVCLKHFKLALSKINNFVSYRHSNVDMSFYEILNEIFLRKQLRNSARIYRRYCLEGHEDDVYAEMYEDAFPPPLHCAVSAYRANVFFTAMKSYKKSFNECNKCFDVLSDMEVGSINKDPVRLHSRIPILICNSFSQIYDEHLQVILGFATLHRNISSSESPNSSTVHEVCLKLDAWEFLKYINIQSEHKLSIKPMKSCHFSYSDSDRIQPCMSQLVENAPFSAAILFAALRHSRSYKSPLRGHLIPHDFRCDAFGNVRHLRLYSAFKNGIQT